MATSKDKIGTESEKQLEKLTEDEQFSSEPTVDEVDVTSSSAPKKRIRQGDKLKMAQFQQLIPEETKEGVRNIDMLLDVTLPVTVELGHTALQVKEILGLNKGSIIELDKSAGEYVELVINNKVIAKGEVVVVEENFGFRITELVSDGNLKDKG